MILKLNALISSKQIFEQVVFGSNDYKLLVCLCTIL